ncbi:hypothetical protein LOTGIDRAFT_176192, partial [Lottia gigantea]
MRLFRCQDARYMVLTPKSIQSCAPYSFSARAFGNHSYTLKTELQRSYSGNTISSITTEILPGDTNTVTLQVPCNLTSWSIYLILTGTGETTFNNRQYLSVNSRNMEIIIQTDKKVYKPGQTVKYRVFGVRSDLQVVCSNYTVTVTLDKNGKGTTVITTEKLKTIAYGRYLSYKTIIGQVNVTDDATGATYISQTSQISVTRTREKLSFVLNPQNYKPALVNRFYIELKQMDGKPVLEPGNIIVSARVKILIPEEPATEPPPPSENSDNSSTPTPPTTPRWRYGHYGWGYGYPPWWYDPNCKDPQYRYENLPEKNLTVPANGLVTYDLLVNETDSVEVYLKVYYVEDTDVYTSRTLTSFKSPSNTFLSVSLKTNKPASGKKVELELKATREFSRVYYT